MAGDATGEIARQDTRLVRQARQLCAAPVVTGPTAPDPAYGRPVPDPRRHLGQLGESLALEHLERLGYRLVARNHRTRFGELDLVVHDDRALVFVEVKTRRASRPGRHWDSLHPGKREQVRRMARAFLSDVEDRPRPIDVRFDAVGVTIDARGRLVALEHLEGAF
jgi:putative endonuclease